MTCRTCRRRPLPTASTAASWPRATLFRMTSSRAIVRGQRRRRDASMAGIDDFLEGNVATGIAVGLAAAVLTSVIAPVLAAVAKPLLKSAIKTGIVLYDK